jgi:hypothetical protein
VGFVARLGTPACRARLDAFQKAALARRAELLKQFLDVVSGLSSFADDDLEPSRRTTTRRRPSSERLVSTNGTCAGC